MELCQAVLQEGQRLFSEGRDSEAKVLLEHVVLDSLNLLGSFYAQKLDRPELAVRCLRLACDIDKGNHTLRSNLAHTLNAMERFEEAAPEALKGVALSHSGLVDPLMNCAVVLNNCQMTEAAIAHYRLCLELEDRLMTRYNLACCLLYNGEYREGWEYYESRLMAFDITKDFEVRIPHTRWKGEDISGKTILIYSEQGIGDLFMFSRFIPEMVTRAGRVILECQEVTAELMRINFPEIEVMGRPNVDIPPPPQAHYAVSVCSLPYLLGYDSVNKISGLEYLQADDRNAPRSLEDKGRLRVGLCWAGNPDHAHDYIRTCSVKNLLPLADVEGVDYFSLQKDTRPVRMWKGKEVFLHEGKEAIPMTDITPFMRNFADTAACLRKLDLVITIDSAVAHLAGAMGIPVWMYMSRLSDWRWYKHRPNTSIWYDSMRVYRQESLHDWGGVIARIRSDLSLASDQTNLS